MVAAHLPLACGEAPGGWLPSLSEGPSSLEKLREASAGDGQELAGDPAAFLALRPALPSEAPLALLKAACWESGTVYALDLVTSTAPMPGAGAGTQGRGLTLLAPLLVLGSCCAWDPPEPSPVPQNSPPGPISLSCLVHQCGTSWTHLVFEPHPLTGGHR